MRWLAVALSACLIASPALAASPGEEAFIRGRELFVAQQYAKALPLLEKSYQLTPSPNSLLLIARCRKELGDVEIAEARFRETLAEAEKRIAAGDAQYEPTATAARTEGAALRAKLAVLRVRVKNADSGTVVITPFTRATIDATVVELVHRPGHFVMTVRTADGRVFDREIDLVAGQSTLIELDAAKPAEKIAPPPAPPAPESPATSSWLVPTGVVFTVLGAGGIAAFGVLGSKSAATYRSLESSCAPTCGADRRGEADTAERQQTIANVALGIGAVALVTGVVMIVAGLPKTETKNVAHLTPGGFVW
jgi:hypothetical protein